MASSSLEEDITVSDVAPLVRHGHVLHLVNAIPRLPLCNITDVGRIDRAKRGYGPHGPETPEESEGAYAWPRIPRFLDGYKVVRDSFQDQTP